jgi:hypothetical protein
MKKKIIFNGIIVICLIFYAISFIATSKVFPTDPCIETTSFWFHKDSIRSNYHYLNYFNDTILIQVDTLYPVNWNPVCDTICGIFKDSCKRTGPSILVINSRDTARSTWDTRFGRKILFRKCP